MSYHSSLKQKVYYALPYPFKVAMATAYGMQQRRARHDRVFAETRASLERSQRWTPEEIAAEQTRTLDTFLADAVAHTPYYRECAYSSIAEAPVLQKAVVQDRLEEFYRDGFRNEPFQWGHTSGTSGRALVFPISANCFQREYAFRSLHYSWGGVDFAGRDKLCFCSGHPVAHANRQRPPFWSQDVANNWLLLSSYHLTAANLPEYIRKLEAYQPVMLGGYPSSLYLLALAYKKYGTGKLKLRSVFTASETLFDHQREAMEEAFGAKVFNWYGNSEMCGHITQCEEGRLHVRHEHSYLEVLNEQDQPCGPGETGRVVATGFHNRLFPLIRYEVGDTVTLSKETECPCGRTGQLVTRIDGRNEDYVATPDGRLVGRLDHLFKDSLQVMEAQIVQQVVDAVTFRIVKRPDFGSNDEQAILREARLRLGSDIQLNFEYVEEIERTANGKFRFIVSELGPSSLLRDLTQS